MLKLIPSPGPLRGVLSVPGDKSVSHRAVMLGSLADGDTVISGFLESADCLSTIGCFRSLGTEISTSGAGYLTVHGQGLRGLKPEAERDLRIPMKPIIRKQSVPSTCMI